MADAMNEAFADLPSGMTSLDLNIPLCNDRTAINNDALIESYKRDTHDAGDTPTKLRTTEPCLMIPVNLCESTPEPESPEQLTKAQNVFHQRGPLTVLNICKSTPEPDDIHKQTVLGDKCTHCGRAGPKGRCAGCKNSPRVDGSFNKGPVYCCKECQAADWAAHKTQCKVQQASKQLVALHRAGEILSSLFYIWREACYDRPITSIKSSGQAIEIYENYDLAPKLSPGGRIYPLNLSLLHDHETKLAVLANMNCDVSLALFHGIIYIFLKDLATAIEEVEVVVKNVLRPIYMCDSARGQCQLQGTHHVLRVHLKSGCSWAVDMTAAQLGWKEIVLPWSDYYAKRCQKVVAVESFGGRRAYFQTVIDNPEVGHAPYRDMANWTRSMGDAFVEIVEDVLGQNNLSISASLNATQSRWTKVEDCIVRSAEEEMKRTATEIDNAWAYYRCEAV